MCGRIQARCARQGFKISSTCAEIAYTETVYVWVMRQGVSARKPFDSACENTFRRVGEEIRVWPGGVRQVVLDGAATQGA